MRGGSIQQGELLAKGRGRGDALNRAHARLMGKGRLERRGLKCDLGVASGKDAVLEEVPYRIRPGTPLSLEDRRLIEQVGWGLVID